MIRISKSVDETVDIGAGVAKKLKAGDVVALIGNLGAGKTVLTKGIARGLGVKNVRYVNSPTFVIIKEHKGRIPLYHLDVYRLNRSNMLDSGSYEEYFYGDGVTVIEWADKIRKILPKKYIEIKLSAAGEGKRRIIIRRK
ncbi:MAG: tRNA (adenosine(37)-N6)-threonylcarbamoyltransferase complex ATPase subunit type 1 TsaE [Candidatus Omnitrophica bacterium]|nr:tRNA (adenosine(37)-N6)-threonylcarbamoyltransferase complex ATPase subunit type 1 TsaE [Candidatus Omnitrophota bacterium]